MAYKSFIDRFVDLTEGVESPTVFRKWTAIACVSGALERRCYTTTWAKLYPNLFVVLVAPPGIGKTVPIMMCHQLWARCEEGLNVAPTTITKAGLIDHYAKTGIRVIPETQELFSSCLVAARELGHLIPEYDLEFLNVLNDLYDCTPVPYVERTRGNGLISIDSPHLSILAGTQPKFLGATLPESAYALGTTSRMIMIYSAEVVKAPLWRDDAPEGSSLLEMAVATLQGEIDRIARLNGEFEFEPGARKLMNEWMGQGEPPRPEHHRLAHYTTRRRATLLKLCMTISASYGGSMKVTEPHMSEAMRIMFEAERTMPEIFKDMSANSQGSVVQDCFLWMLQRYQRTQKAIPETQVVRFLQQRLPAAQIRPTFDAMLRSDMLKIEPAKGLTTIRGLIPQRPDEMLED